MTAFDDFLVDNFLYKAGLFESDLLDDINSLVDKSEVSAIRNRLENSVSLDYYNDLLSNNQQLELENSNLFIENGELQDEIMELEQEVENLLSEIEEI